MLFNLLFVNICSITRNRLDFQMKVSETTQKIYEGISNILKENG